MMDSSNDCAWFMCFGPAPPPLENNIFGFGEFVGAIALLLVFFNIVDFRYRFRLLTLPNYFLRTVLWVIGFIGIGTLAMELWLLEGWWTLRTPISPGMWATIFALLFLITFVVLTYRLFVYPPTFSQRNALRFARAVYRILVKGDDAELAVLADELGRSSEQLVSFCATHDERSKDAESPDAIAYDILRLISHRRLCRHVVGSSQSTAISIFQHASSQEKYAIPIGAFSQTVTEEAIRDKDSMLYMETEDFVSDIIGEIKPWSTTLYGDYKLIHSFGFHSPLNIRLYSLVHQWDADQCGAYTKVLSAILEGYTKTRARYDPTDLGHAIEDLEWFVKNLCGTIATDSHWQSEDHTRLRLVIDFAKNAAELLDNADPPMHGQLRVRSEFPRDIYQSIAKLLLETLQIVSGLEGKQMTLWGIQYGMVWGEIFRRIGKPSRSMDIIRARLVRLLYGQIKELDRDKLGPNYLGVRAVGLILNLVGLESPSRKTRLPTERSIHYFARRWAKENYLKLFREYPDVAQSLLVGSLEFDQEKSRLVKKYAGWLGKEGTKTYLELDSPMVNDESS